MDLENISTEELQKELTRRIAIKFAAPKQLEKFDVGPLQKICQSYIDKLDKKKYVDEKQKHYIYEAAMETIFGKNIWEWINEKLA